MRMLLAFLLAVAPADLERVLHELDQGRFAAAEAALAGEDDPLLRARGQTEILYRGRDFPAALRAAEAGLERDPSDLVLRHRAAASALWLERAGRAREHLAELERALAAADAETRGAWSATVEDFRARGAAIEAREADRRRRVARARIVSATALVLLVGAFAWSLRPTREGRDSGAA